MAVTGTPERTAVSPDWVRRYGLMFFGQNLSWAAPTQILLAVQVLAFYPHDKERMLGWLMAAGGLASVLAGPITGRLSDRTRARRGNRLRWLVGGTIASVLTLVLAGLAGGYTLLLVAWVAFQIALRCSITSIHSIPPDRVPDDQYGLVSGVMGLTYTGAVVVASAIAAVLPVLAAYIVVGLLMLLCLLPFAVRYAGGIDGDDTGRARSKTPLARTTPGFTFPPLHEAQDFWWVFLARLLVTMAQAIALFYLLYFLRDRIHYSDPDTGVLILTAIYAVFVIVTAIWSGRASDRVGKRRPFVSLSSFGVAIACIVMAFATSLPVVIAAAALLGLSWGVFQAIDQALINHVLPSADDRAAHMGVVDLAVTIPNTAAPAIAALLVTEVGGYTGLYGVAAVLTIAGGLVVWKVRSVP